MMIFNATSRALELVQIFLKFKLKAYCVKKMLSAEDKKNIIDCLQNYEGNKNNPAYNSWSRIPKNSPVDILLNDDEKSFYTVHLINKNGFRLRMFRRHHISGLNEFYFKKHT